jgi:endonuclease YncB( thermonuclease family)
MPCLPQIITKCFTTNSDSKLAKQLEIFDDKTPILSLNGITTLAKCTKCYDADTVHLVIPYNNGYYRWTCRLEEIDSAEIKSKNIKEREHAIKARDYLCGLILNKIVEIKCGKFDKYGRLLVYISIGGLEINRHLVKEGYAYKYNGGAKIEFNEWKQVIV